mmetsp:Transcript_3513/g.13450  ORF Transcript_3513/g.13450 Transcript_3513/m.13450 type:complete len:100 (-) Transcript_3513:844-1143(-)
MSHTAAGHATHSLSSCKSTLPLHMVGIVWLPVMFPVAHALYEYANLPHIISFCDHNCSWTGDKGVYETLFRFVIHPSAEEKRCRVLFQQYFQVPHNLPP